MRKASAVYPAKLSNKFLTERSLLLFCTKTEARFRTLPPHRRKPRKPRNDPIIFNKTSLKEENLDGRKTCRSSTVNDNPKLANRITARVTSPARGLFCASHVRPKPNGRNSKMLFRTSIKPLDFPHSRMTKGCPNLLAVSLKKKS